MPLLENLGFNVISERTFDVYVTAKGGSTGHVVLHDMELETRSGLTIDLARHGAALEEAFLAAFGGTIDNDAFNRLIVSADLSARETNVLRAYSRYLRQAGIAYSQDYISATLDKYPRIAASLFRLFHDTLDPKLSDKNRTKKLSELHASIEAELADVPSLDDDRILRRYVNAIDLDAAHQLFPEEYGRHAEGHARLQARSQAARWPARTAPLPRNLRLRR